MQVVWGDVEEAIAANDDTACEYELRGLAMASNRQRVRQASCLYKATFRSVADAEAAIEEIDRRVVGFSGMHIYECRFGKHLHIGHEKNRPSIRSLAWDFPLAIQEA